MMLKGMVLLTQSENKALLAAPRETLPRGSWPGWVWKGKQPTVCSGRCSGHDHMKQRLLLLMCITFSLSRWDLGRRRGRIFPVPPCNTAFYSIVALLMQDHAYWVNKSITLYLKSVWNAWLKNNWSVAWSPGLSLKNSCQGKALLLRGKNLQDKTEFHASQNYFNRSKSFSVGHSKPQ